MGPVRGILFLARRALFFVTLNSLVITYAWHHRAVALGGTLADMKSHNQAGMLLKETRF
jgi:hypothetical protein